MTGIRNSSRHLSEFDRALTTVQKAEESGKQLRVDKKGNLKVVGFFGNLFLKYKLRTFSKNRYGEYLQGERREIRVQVLQKLEGLAKQSREKAILGILPEGVASEEVQEEIETHLQGYIQSRKATRQILGGTERKEELHGVDLNEITDDVFNRDAVNFLQNSKRPMFARKPVAPDCYVRDVPLGEQIDQSTGGDKAALMKYGKSLGVYERTVGLVPGERDAFSKDYRVDPGERLHGSQVRVQFFDPTEDALFDKFIERSESIVASKPVQSNEANNPVQSNEAKELIQRRLERVVFNVVEKPEGPLFITPKKEWNKEDFRNQAGKRVGAEVRKRNLGELGESKQAVDFLCFLRKEVQKKFTKRGELPEQFQSLFNENSAVSIPGSTAKPDRFIPSRKLVRTALDLCLSRLPEGEPNVENTEGGALQKPVAFSDKVMVRETTSRESDAMATRYAVVLDELSPDPKERVGLFFDSDRQRLPMPASKEDLDNPAEHFSEDHELPEGFKKFVPKDVPTSLLDESLSASIENGDVVVPPGSDAGVPDRSSDLSGIDWVNKLYGKWLKTT